MKAELENKIMQLIAEKGNCRVGVYLSFSETEEVWEYNSREVFVSASTIKVPLLAALLKDAEDGRLDLQAASPAAEENRVLGSGILQSLSPKLALTLFDKAVLMIALSDNVATNEVIDAVGMDRANAFFAAQGWEGVCLRRKMMPKPGTYPPGQKPENSLSAEVYGRILNQMRVGTLVSPRVSQQMKQLLFGCRNESVAGKLPLVHHYDPYVAEKLPPEGKVLVAGKGGHLEDPHVRHGGGVVYFPDGSSYTLVVMTAGLKTEDGTELIRDISLAVYNSLKEQ